MPRTSTQTERLARLERAVAQLARETIEARERIHVVLVKRSPDLASILEEHPEPKRGTPQVIGGFDALYGKDDDN
jgi:hypothetical protein